MHFRRRNLAWLSVIGTLVALVVVSGAASPQLTLALLGIFVLALLASVLDMRPAEFREKMPRSPLSRMRMSPQAQEATERARRRRGALPTRKLTLLDVGLISTISSPDGMVMRRSRNVSQDDDGVRPYIVMHVDPAEADRAALVRFEIIDNNGQQMYVHEMETYLRDGEMNILADHHLPLFGNERITSVGDWDLRVYVDGGLTGLLGFAVSPSLEARARYLRREREQIVDEEGEIPPSVADLLEKQSARSRR